MPERSRALVEEEVERLSIHLRQLQELHHIDSTLPNLTLR